ncbi:diadenylate cyclase, partial [Thermodesulfobacteriota bacterium]
MNDLFFNSLNLRWQDIVDIALNSYIIFRIYVLFRKTKAFKLLVGIVVLWLLQRIAVSMGLIITSWAVQGIMAVAAIIIIIVFKDEMLLVLQANRLGAILWGFPKKISPTDIDVIVDSVNDLSKTKTGALIVLPQKDDLEDILQGGIKWQGTLSKEMLLSIFWPKNPVHDGAALVLGSRVEKVGAILPLSSRNDLPSHFGTRHRAALGLVEKSDALVVVVSEETGNIHLAEGSELRAIKGKEGLKRILRERFEVEVVKPGLTHKENLWIGIAALVSVLFITGVWFSFSRGVETLITLDVPIQYTNRDPELEVIESSHDAVRVYLGGSGSLIRSIRAEDVQVRLKLDKTLPGENSFYITQDNISLPPGVYLKKIEPSTIQLTLDKLVTKELPIQATWKGQFDKNLILTDVILS